MNPDVGKLMSAVRPPHFYDNGLINPTSTVLDDVWQIMENLPTIIAFVRATHPKVVTYRLSAEAIFGSLKEMNITCRT